MKKQKLPLVMLIVSALLTTFWLSPSAVADDIDDEEVPFKKLKRQPFPLDEPGGTTCVINGVEHKAYSLEDYKIIATIIIDYNTLWLYADALELKLKSDARIIAAHESRLSGYKTLVEQEATRIKHLNALIEQQKQMLADQRKAGSGSWFPWVLVGALSIGFGIYAGVYH